MRSIWKKPNFATGTLETYPKKIHFSIRRDLLKTAPVGKDDQIEAKVNIESRE
ncbi:MAG: hypothetical protein ACRCX4_11740 [Bacteroidales bacterium]